MEVGIFANSCYIT